MTPECVGTYSSLQEHGTAVGQVGPSEVPLVRCVQCLNPLHKKPTQSLPRAVAVELGVCRNFLRLPCSLASTPTLGRQTTCQTGKGMLRTRLQPQIVPQDLGVQFRPRQVEAIAFLSLLASYETSLKPAELVQRALPYCKSSTMRVQAASVAEALESTAPVLHLDLQHTAK